MANQNRPMGFIPVTKLDGGKIPTKRFNVSTVSANLFVGDVVKKVASGGVDIAAASDGILIVGVVAKLEDTNGTAIGSPQSLISTKFLASGGSGKAIIALCTQDAMFRIQANGNTLEADIWQQAAFVVTGGSTVTARSKTQLNTSSQVSSAEELQIIGKFEEPGNAWGTNVDLLVTFNESTWIGNGSPVGV